MHSNSNIEDIIIEDIVDKAINSRNLKYLYTTYLSSTDKTKEKQQIFDYISVKKHENDDIIMLLLGYCYLLGIGTEKNTILAFSYYDRSAASGNVCSINVLGHLYETGTGTEKNLDLAFEKYRLATEFEEPNAINNLGRFYDEGIVVEKNEQMAFKLYSRAAELKNAAAHYNLGICYFLGIGTNIDYHMSYIMFFQSSRMGFGLAIEFLKTTDGHQLAWLYNK